MKIALIGYGAMGKLIHELAEARGHAIAAVVDSSASVDLTDKLMDADVAIDFSSADAVPANIGACVAVGVPIVEGTTGWNEQLGEIKKIVTDSGGAFVYGANFSIGVNLFYRVADLAADLFSRFPEYRVLIEEQHHTRKKDAPSGTAIKLKEVISKHSHHDIPIESVREGDIPGTHQIIFDGPADKIVLEHAAHSRKGFASGAIIAAEWVVGRTGFYEFTEVFDEILGGDHRGEE